MSKKFSKEEVEKAKAQRDSILGNLEKLASFATSEEQRKWFKAIHLDFLKILPTEEGLKENG